MKWETAVLIVYRVEISFSPVVFKTPNKEKNVGINERVATI
jgi:hypothetical protein